MSDTPHLPTVFDEPALQRLEALDPTGQNQLFVRVMKAFEVSLMRMSAQLAGAREQHDLAGMRHVVHTLKSSAASMGALRLSQLCLDVEADLRGLSPAATPNGATVYSEVVGEVLTEMGRVQAAVPELLVRRQRAPARPSDAVSDRGTGAAPAGR
ncbi:MAG: hypothetical protein RIQ60_650 [Pseudomonadota bacterium]|jgi:HPt (histidine-containing phosphotransfer) domain-containing protein